VASSAAAVAGAIHVESRDGLQRGYWRPGGASVLDVLADLHSVAPIWAATRDSLASVAFDDQLPGLELIDAWVQLVDRHGSATILSDAIGRIDSGHHSRWHALAASPDYAATLERFLRKHQCHVDACMAPLLIDREIRFGRLRHRHLELLRRRDEALRELDELRARAAHHRAFLAHHGLDALDWGSFDRVDPVARDWGYARGGPVDRPYIRDFIARHSSDVKGSVLEVQEDDLARRFGGGRVERCDVIDIDPSNSRATIVADLRAATEIPGERFDCVILTQTAHVVDDLDSVMRTCHRILKPGGVLLATFPCVSRVCLEYGPAADFWRMTPAGAREVTAKAFGPDVEVSSFGNVQVTMAFLHGLGEAELPPERYAATDPYNPTLVGVRARRSPAGRAQRRTPRGVVLLYHRVSAIGRDPFDLNVSP
jgi:hypothetical protein